MHPMASSVWYCSASPLCVIASHAYKTVIQATLRETVNLLPLACTCSSFCCCAAGTLYAFLNVAAGLLFYRLYDPKVSTRADLIKVLAHLGAICAASVGEGSGHTPPPVTLQSMHTSDAMA